MSLSLSVGSSWKCLMQFIATHKMRDEQWLLPTVQLRRLNTLTTSLLLRWKPALVAWTWALRVRFTFMSIVVRQCICPVRAMMTIWHTMVPKLKMTPQWTVWRLYGWSSKRSSRKMSRRLSIRARRLLSTSPVVFRVATRSLKSSLRMATKLSE